MTNWYLRFEISQESERYSHLQGYSSQKIWNHPFHFYSRKSIYYYLQFFFFFLICLQWRSHRRCRFDPWVGKIPWRRAWQRTPVFLPGESHGQNSLAGYSPQGCRVDHERNNWARAHNSLSNGTYFPLSLPCSSTICTNRMSLMEDVGLLHYKLFKL